MGYKTKEEKNIAWNKWYRKSKGYEPKEETECVICKKKFIRKSIRNKCCSTECSKELHKKNDAERAKNKYRQKTGYYNHIQKCKFCGKEFHMIRYSKTKDYCSNRQCRLEHQKEINTKWYTQKVGYKVKDKVKCVICGDEFIRVNVQQKFCPKSECEFKYIQNRKIKRFKKINGYVPHEKAVCIYCGKEFIKKRNTDTRCYEKQCYEKSRKDIRIKHYKNMTPEQIKLRYKKRKNNVNYVLANNYRTRVRRSLKAKNVEKNEKTNYLVGCSFAFLRKYLEERFQPGMTWENYNFRGWHVDHIIPVSTFDLSIKEERLKAYNYKNLQPLWGIENLKKSNKYEKV